MKRLGILLAVLSGCGTGDEVPITPDPRVCAANLTLAGTFTLGMPVPDVVNNDTGMAPPDGIPDINGCWPTGTWTFSATVLDSTCADEPPLLPSYSFRTDYVINTNGDPEYTYTLLTPDPAVTHNSVKVSSGGGGLCEGIFELFSDDGLQTWNLHPTLDTFNASGPLGGSGEFAIFTTDQW